MAGITESNPVILSIDYPDRPLNRLTTFFRIITLIPVGIILGLISGGENAAGGLLFPPVVLMILFREKYPRWWFDWNIALTKFNMRVAGYLCLLTDEYPSTDEEQAVHVNIRYPDVPNDLNRWLPLVKWLLAIPHYIVLALLAVGAFFCVVVAWFAILFTGRYPKGLFDFVVGVYWWSLRVSAYAFLLTTDRYPVFSLD